MSLVNYPIFESPIVLFETEKGEMVFGCSSSPLTKTYMQG
jgi:hypothetical protein